MRSEVSWAKVGSSAPFDWGARDAPATLGCMTEATTPPRRGSRLGAWALILAVVGAVWFFGGLYLGFYSMREDAVGAVTVIAGVLVTLGWFVVPLALLGALVLGILALVLNNRRGRLLGILAFVMLVLFLGAILLWVFAAFGGFGS